MAWHNGLVIAINQLAEAASDTTNVKVAVISTAGVVIVAALGTLGTIWQKNRSLTPTQHAVPMPISDPESPLTKELRRQIAEKERELQNYARVVKDKNKRIDALETLCWNNHINPLTGSGEDNA